MTIYVELQNGHQVHYDCYAATYHYLQALFKNKPEAALGLLERCNGMSDSERFKKSTITLQNYRFIDANEEIDPDVREVVLNALKTESERNKEAITLTLSNTVKRFIAMKEKPPFTPSGPSTTFNV